MTFAHHIRAAIRTPDAKRLYNEQLFTRVAPEYDRATWAMSLGRDLHWKRQMVQALAPMTSPRCVDLACGTGDVTAALAARFPDGEVLGVDLTPAMVELARARGTRGNVRFAVGDMARTGLPDGWADLVTGSYALRNAPVLDDALHEVHRLLRPGGQAAFLDFAKSPVRWRQAVQMVLLRYWGGMWGVLIHGRPEHVYIAESLRQFPDRRALRARFVQHGFELGGACPCLGGWLEILVVRKR